MNEQYKTLEEKLSEVKLGDLPKKDFKIRIIKRNRPFLKNV